MPKHKIPMARSKSLMSVYPPPWAADILMKAAVTYNAALSCWATMLEKASIDNDKAFSPAEWELLQRAVISFQFLPESSDPGRQIAAILMMTAWRDRPENSKDLQKRLMDLDYVHTWALIWSCWFKEKHPEMLEWWTIETRAKRL